MSNTNNTNNNTKNNDKEDNTTKDDKPFCDYGGYSRRIATLEYHEKTK